MPLSRQIVFFTVRDDLILQVKSVFRGTGLSIEFCSVIEDLIKKIVKNTSTAESAPAIVLIDSSIGKRQTLDLCIKVREHSSAEELAVLVLVRDHADADLSALLSVGADDLISHPIQPLTFHANINAHLARIAAGHKLAQKVHDSAVLIDVTSRLVSSADILDNLYDVAQLIAEELSVDRCSVILVRPQGDFGLVVASSDDAHLRSLAINLKRYPEISIAIDRSEPLIIDDVVNSELLRQVLPNLLDAGVASVALFPITRQQETLGVIFLRFLEKREVFEEREIVFCRTVANAASIALRNAEILELLKAKTREVEKVQIEVADKLRRLKRYEDFFIGALDGMVALEQSGKVVFVNPKAALMIGADSEALVGRPFADILIPEERGEFNRLLDEYLIGEARRTVDFLFQGNSDAPKIMTISAGSMFGEAGMMLLTLRDVTEEREIQRRLSDAQRRLVLSEKRAAMAELAGAAAHELNQPLTSVMASVSMLRRLIDNDASEQRIINTMEQEAERMASIIRRMTKITNYTTKSYVGEAKIIDLSTACLDDTDPASDELDDGDE